MVQRTELEKNVRDLVAYNVLQAPLSSFYQKAKRRQGDLAKSIVTAINGGQTAERVVARVETRTQEKARTLKEGMAAFKKLHPRYGALLEGIIAEKRLKQKTLLVYGVQERFKLGDVDYLRVLQDLGMSKAAAEELYPSLQEISDDLGKAAESAYREMLVK